MKYEEEQRKFPKQEHLAVGHRYIPSLLKQKQNQNWKDLKRETRSKGETNVRECPWKSEQFDKVKREETYVWNMCHEKQHV